MATRGRAGARRRASMEDVEQEVSATPRAGAKRTVTYYVRQLPRYLKLLGGPLIPLSVTLQGGAGYARNHVIALPSGGSSSDPITEWRFPVGLGIAMTLPNPVLASGRGSRPASTSCARASRARRPPRPPSRSAAGSSSTSSAGSACIPATTGADATASPTAPSVSACITPSACRDSSRSAAMSRIVDAAP